MLKTKQNRELPNRKKTLNYTLLFTHTHAFETIDIPLKFVIFLYYSDVCIANCSYFCYIIVFEIQCSKASLIRVSQSNQMALTTWLWSHTAAISQSSKPIFTTPNRKKKQNKSNQITQHTIKSIASRYNLCAHRFFHCATNFLFFRSKFQIISFWLRKKKFSMFCAFVRFSSPFIISVYVSFVVVVVLFRLSRLKSTVFYATKRGTNFSFSFNLLNFQ